MHNVRSVRSKVINSRKPFCLGPRIAGGATIVNQHLSTDCANTRGPGHSMIKQCLISALASIFNLKTFFTSQRNSLCYILTQKCESFSLTSILIQCINTISNSQYTVTKPQFSLAFSYLALLPLSSFPGSKCTFPKKMNNMATGQSVHE